VFLLVPAYPGSPGPKRLNGCVCVCVTISRHARPTSAAALNSAVFHTPPIQHYRNFRKVIQVATVMVVTACIAAATAKIVLSYSPIGSNVKGKRGPYSITARRVPEMIPVLGSHPASDVSHKPGGCHYFPSRLQLYQQPS